MRRVISFNRDSIVLDTSLLLALLVLLTLLFSQHSVPAADAPPTSKPADNWQSLFDGKTLGKWKASDFAGHGEPEVEDGNLMLPFGVTLTGITYSGEVPKMSY